MFVVSTSGVSVREVMNVRIGMRCLKQESFPSRTLKTVIMGKLFFFCMLDFVDVYSTLVTYSPNEICEILHVSAMVLIYLLSVSTLVLWKPLTYMNYDVLFLC